MIIDTKKFKEICNSILYAIDNSELSTLTEALELKTENKILYLNVTNKEYFVSVKFDLDHEEEFHATVNAILFLKLINSITSNTIELQVKDTYVLVKANGNYRVNLIFNDNNYTLLTLPKIQINNQTLAMNISGTILNSIFTYNSKELLKETVNKIINKMYYLDEKGCITITNGACINSFQLEKPVKLLLTNRIVKLFKLFKDDLVNFKLGYDQISEDIIQTKVMFSNSNIELTAITGCDNNLLQIIPAAALREKVESNYKYNITLAKDELLQAINRLSLFNPKTAKPYFTFNYSNNNLTIKDSSGMNSEIIITDIPTKDNYSMTLDLNDLKLTLTPITEKYITLSFGDNKYLLIKRANICNLIPECN